MIGPFFGSTIRLIAVGAIFATGFCNGQVASTAKPTAITPKQAQAKTVAAKPAVKKILRTKRRKRSGMRKAAPKVALKVLAGTLPRTVAASPKLQVQVPVAMIKPSEGFQKSIPWGKPGTKIGDETINPIDQMLFVWIPAGDFDLGTNDTDADGGLLSAKPVKHIHLSGFWMGKYPVTWDQYARYCKVAGTPVPADPGFTKTGVHPVIHVNWTDAIAYAHWAHVALPTEFQWEHAARGPQNSKYPWGDSWNANMCANSVSYRLTGSVPVGSYQGSKSAYGCFDMAGNVSQWCSNWFNKDYSSITGSDPTGPPTGTMRAVRGAGWGAISSVVFRSSFRYHLDPTLRLDIVGFRCAVRFP